MKGLDACHAQNISPSVGQRTRASAHSMPCRRFITAPAFTGPGFMPLDAMLMPMPIEPEDSVASRFPATISLRRRGKRIHAPFSQRCLYWVGVKAIIMARQAACLIIAVVRMGYLAIGVLSACRHLGL